MPLRPGRSGTGSSGPQPRVHAPPWRVSSALRPSEAWRTARASCAPRIRMAPSASSCRTASRRMERLTPKRAISSVSEPRRWPTPLPRRITSRITVASRRQASDGRARPVQWTSALRRGAEAVVKAAILPRIKACRYSPPRSPARGRYAARRASAGKAQSASRPSENSTRKPPIWQYSGRAPPQYVAAGLITACSGVPTGSVLPSARKAPPTLRH